MIGKKKHTARRFLIHAYVWKTKKHETKRESFQCHEFDSWDAFRRQIDALEKNGYTIGAVEARANKEHHAA